MYHSNKHFIKKEDKQQALLVDQLNELIKPDGLLNKNMFNGKNLRQFTKHMIQFSSCPMPLNEKKYTSNASNINSKKQPNQTIQTKQPIQTKQMVTKDTIYKPYKKDSLFWCFYILKYGFSKYEMEVGNQQFSIEKQEKFKYIDELRKAVNKDLLKIHKIKPLSLLEDDLANQERISIKTFFALCIIENMNIILIDKRKVYEVLTTDDPKIHIIHRNSLTYEHHIELDVPEDKIKIYKETYYKMSNFDTSLKAMTSYKVEELVELCKKLEINTDIKEKKKMTKKDIYELLVQQF
jgi:hypothetical protein